MHIRYSVNGHQSRFIRVPTVSEAKAVPPRLKSRLEWLVSDVGQAPGADRYMRECSCENTTYELVDK